MPKIPRATPPQKFSDALADWLVELGYTHCFMVAGGGCMHLIDGFRTRFIMIPVVHEVSAGIAAEHFNECRTAGRAFALVTTGPGFTNIVTAIAGCYTERRELLVIAGQVKSTDLITGRLRQLGVQEIDGSAITAPITVVSRCLREPIGRAEFQALVKAGSHPHPGPVVIEVCLDVQGAQIDRVALDGLPFSLTCGARPKHLASGHDLESKARQIADILSKAKRPVLLIGGLVSRALSWSLLAAMERAGVPLMTTTSAMDRVPDLSPVYVGRPSSWGGQRSANLIIAQADVVVGVGVQWDLQQTGFNWQEYAPGIDLYQVYPDQEELNKGQPVLAEGIAANPDEFLASLVPSLDWQDPDDWLTYAKNIRAKVPLLEPANVCGEGFISNYVLLQELSRATAASDVIAFTSSGNCFTGGLQMLEIKHRQFTTTSPAFASMGYGLASAIGAAFAHPGKRIIHFEGDGGFCQNLQELALLHVNQLPVKMFIFENGGYASIRATQRKFFNGAYVGCDEATGLGFPDWIKLFNAYHIPARYLRPEEANSRRLAQLLAEPGAAAWIVRVDPDQPNFPAVSSRIALDGKIQSNPLYQQIPTLSDMLLAEVGRFLPR